MEVSASTSLSKTPAKRAHSTTVSPNAAGKKPAPRKAKKPAVRSPSAEEITLMISSAAYYLAADRGFTPGHEMDDWLQAEKQILALYG